MQMDRAQKYVYFPWMVYRLNPITPNIRIGWVLASRIARVKLDGPARREPISLDPQGQAVADPHGLALSPDEQWLVCAASGTQELLVYRLGGLPFQDYGGSDHIDPALLKDKDRFARIPLGGRPMAVRFAKDGRSVFVANYLLNAVQVVDLPSRKIARVIPLGGPKEPSLVRRGAAIFYDGHRSLDQWYSCHSCHYEGHTNRLEVAEAAVVFRVRHYGVGPYFWHGWEKDLKKAVRRSMVDTMLGKEPKDDDVEALIAYFDTLTPPPNPIAARTASCRSRPSAARRFSAAKKQAAPVATADRTSPMDASTASAPTTRATCTKVTIRRRCWASSIARCSCTTAGPSRWRSCCKGRIIPRTSRATANSTQPKQRICWRICAPCEVPSNTGRSSVV
jgi:hypothetical protein